MEWFQNVLVARAIEEGFDVSLFVFD